ncbi:hypothetical protein BFRIG_01369 [Peribacillus frigoritolerans]
MPLILRTEFHCNIKKIVTTKLLALQSSMDYLRCQEQDFHTLDLPRSHFTKHSTTSTPYSA